MAINHEVRIKLTGYAGDVADKLKEYVTKSLARLNMIKSKEREYSIKLDLKTHKESANGDVHNVKGVMIETESQVMASIEAFCDRFRATVGSNFDRGDIITSALKVTIVSQWGIPRGLLKSLVELELDIREGSSNVYWNSF